MTTGMLRLLDAIRSIPSSGEIDVDSIEPIGLPDITPELARASGFLSVVDLLKVANHAPRQ